MPQNLGSLTRREFLKTVAVGGVAFVAFGPASLAAEPQIKTIHDIPGLSLEVKDWKPVDVTDIVRNSLRGDDTLLFKPSEFSCNSQNNMWRFGHTVDGKQVGVHYLHTSELGKKYGGTFLFDHQAKKVYTLLYGDDKLAGFPSADFTIFGDPHRIADNGVTIYGVTWPQPRKGEGTTLDAVVIADYKNSRKIVVKAKEGSKIYWPNTDMSKEGNRVILQDQSGFYIVEIENQQVVYSGKDYCGGMNNDASVIAFNRNNAYYRRDVSIKLLEN